MSRFDSNHDGRVDDVDMQYLLSMFNRPMDDQPADAPQESEVPAGGGTALSEEPEASASRISSKSAESNRTGQTDGGFDQSANAGSQLHRRNVHQLREDRVRTVQWPSVSEQHRANAAGVTSHQRSETTGPNAQSGDDDDREKHDAETDIDSEPERAERRCLSQPFGGNVIKASLNALDSVFATWHLDVAP
jgi:hypothetical protein